MGATKIKKEKKGYTLIHQGQVLVNGLSPEDVFSIIPDLNKEKVRRVGEGNSLSVKSLRKISLQ
ncbi:MAG: hypothetical protein HQL72_09345 [Magnetococcales bacterium]|nr:hypothetical protein [Magnetococcales bacterium]